MGAAIQRTGWRRDERDVRGMRAIRRIYCAPG
jgi:hypothetical protein